MTLASAWNSSWTKTAARDWDSATAYAIRRCVSFQMPLLLWTTFRPIANAVRLLLNRLQGVLWALKCLLSSQHSTRNCKIPPVESLLNLACQGIMSHETTHARNRFYGDVGSNLFQKSTKSRKSCSSWGRKRCKECCGYPTCRISKLVTGKQCDCTCGFIGVNTRCLVRM